MVHSTLRRAFLDRWTGNRRYACILMKHQDATTCKHMQPCTDCCDRLWASSLCSVTQASEASSSSRAMAVAGGVLVRYAGLGRNRADASEGWSRGPHFTRCNTPQHTRKLWRVSACINPTATTTTTTRAPCRSQAYCVPRCPHHTPAHTLQPPCAPTLHAHLGVSAPVCIRSRSVSAKERTHARSVERVHQRGRRAPAHTAGGASHR